MGAAIVGVVITPLMLILTRVTSNPLGYWIWMILAFMAAPVIAARIAWVLGFREGLQRRQEARPPQPPIHR